MKDSAWRTVETVLDYIENHLMDGKLRLEDIAAHLNYSKYHLHRMFVRVAGITPHDYVMRRQLTEAARLLVFSEKPILDIALSCGYESQQAFTAAFGAMYKRPPAQFRVCRSFYPLQGRFTLHEEEESFYLSKADIRPAGREDIPSWMDLVQLAVDGHPCLNEGEYTQKLSACIRKKTALILKAGQAAVGALMFCPETGGIEFMGIHPQYRKRGISGVFLDALLEDYLPGREIHISTFREHDRADTGYRKELQELGFSEKELLVEYGYPTQRFVHPPRLGRNF